VREKERQGMKEQMNKMSAYIGNLTSMFQTLMASQTSQNTTARLPSQPEDNPK
jgi:hypothetical protein